MHVSRIARRRLVFGLSVVVTACVGKTPNTYTPNITNFPEELPPGVSSDPAVFRAQIAGRTPGPSHHRNRSGEQCGGCVVDVEIGPLGDTREVDPRPPSNPPLPGTGRAVAKILNHDATRTEEMYQLKPMNQREYYVWADTSGGNARITLLSVPRLGLPGSVRATFQKHLRICHDGHGRPTYTDADFRECPGVTLASNNYVAASLARVPLKAMLTALRRILPATIISPPIWLGCLSGCCS